LVFILLWEVRMANFKNPYVHFVDTPSRNMRGKGAPRSTVFGVLGQTKMDPYSRSLGGLVKQTTGSKAVKKGEVEHIGHPRGAITEKGAVSVVPKTLISQMHYAQVPYAGMYMAAAGKELS